MRGYEVELVFSGTALEPAIPANKLTELLLDIYGGGVKCLYYEKSLKLSDLPKHVRSSQRRAFQFKVEDVEARFIVLPNYQHSFLSLANSAGESAWPVLVNLFEQREDFFLARTYDRLYDYWQNMTDVRGLISLGLPTENIRFIHDNTFNIDKIDISCNPGRRVLQVGYVEAIGAEMWLGANYHLRFPELNQHLPDKFIFSSTNYITHITGDIPYFTRPVGEQQQMQDNLRKALFPNN